MEDMNEIISALSGIKVIPVIAISDANRYGVDTTYISRGGQRAAFTF
jgi:hypothetical protein